MEPKKFNLVLENLPGSKSKKFDEDSNSSADLITKIAGATSRLQGETIVIKISENVIESQELLESFANNVKTLSSSGANIIIIHEYMGLIDKLLLEIGVKKIHKNVTHYGSFELIEMIVSGIINKRIVSALCKAQNNAIGISGRDANLIHAKKKEIIAKDNKTKNNILGLNMMGEPILVNPEIIINFEESGLIPVISPVASSETSAPYLVDSDLASSLLASSVSAKYLVLFSKDGQITQEGKKIDIFENNNLNKLPSSFKNTNLHSEILSACKTAYENNIEEIIIADSNVKDALILSLFLKQNCTTIYNSSY